MTVRPPARRRRASAALVAALALTGCTTIPQSSAVRTAPPLEGNRPAADAAQFRPPGPSPEADAVETLKGFLVAGTAPQDDYGIARQYLDEPVRQSWRPERRTVVYSAEPTITRAEGGDAWQIQVEVDSVVDEDGRRTMAPPGTTEAWRATVVQRPEGLRIAAVDDGTLVSSAQFSQIYAPHELTFYDQTMTYGVPDVRWFVNRGTTPTAVARALLRGPAPYLSGAVATAFPLRTGAELARPTVTVDEGGVAHVDVTQGTVEGADAESRYRMQEQLSHTLTGLSSITSVEVTVEGTPLTVSGGASAPLPVRTDPPAESVQVGVDPATGSLAFFQGLSVTPVGGLPDVAGRRPLHPAMSHDRSLFAFLTDGGRTLALASTTGAHRDALTGEALTAPSLDAQGWAWTADPSQDSKVTAVQAAPELDGAPRVVTTPWKRPDETIVALRVSRGGARAALIVDDGVRRTLRLAGVVRGSDGVPTSLTEPILLPTTGEVEAVSWMGSSSLVATDLADGPEDRVTPQVVSIDGTTRQLNPLAGLTGISAGDQGVLFAETPDAVFMLVGSSWRAQDLTRGVRDLAFPG